MTEEWQDELDSLRALLQKFLDEEVTTEEVQDLVEDLLEEIAETEKDLKEPEE